MRGKIVIVVRRKRQLVSGGGDEAEPVSGRLGSVESIAKPTLGVGFAFCLGEDEGSASR